jgi:hypothetical protein
MGKSTIFSDILKEKNGLNYSYSQGRVYLFVSIICYYIIIGLITTKSLKAGVVVDVNPLKMVIDALQWSMGLFAGYVFGGKGLEVLKVLVKKGTDDPSPTLPTPDPIVPTPVPTPDSVVPTPVVQVNS